jgi:hypothetical protein
VIRREFLAMIAPLNNPRDKIATVRATSSNSLNA